MKRFFFACAIVLYFILSCTQTDQTENEYDIPAVEISQDQPLILARDSGIRIWDVSRIPDRDSKRIEFPHLAWFKGHFYCSFREGTIHGNHISGRGRVIRSADGLNWETAALFESPTGDVRDPRLSVSPNGKLVVNSSIAFLEEVAPYQTIDGQTVRRQSVTWLSEDGETWSETYACPTGINTWRWDVAWNDEFGYSIGYSGKDGNGTLYRTRDGITWEAVQSDLFPGGHGNEAALSFGPDGTLYVLLRAGLEAHVALGSSPPPFTEWQWHELDAYWNGPDERQPAKTIEGMERDLGGPNLITLNDGRLLGAGRLRGEVRANFFLIDPKEKTLTRIAGIRNGSSYPGLIQHQGDIWISTIARNSGTGPVYINRLRF